MSATPKSGRILRVAMAMGGGVSLGTFSSAALVETLRFLRITLSNEFTGFEIDAISGASAGSLTMAIMLHGLLYADVTADPRLQQQREQPDDDYVRELVGAIDKPATNAPKLSPPANANGTARVTGKKFSTEQKAHGERLFACYSARLRAGEYGARLPELIDDLWRLSELEKTMDHVWNDLLNVSNLTAPKAGEDHQAFHCLFNFRGAVEDAGRIFLQEKPLCSASPMLAKRLLMGCTLTNLNALPGRYEKSDRSGELKDAEDAAENRELRIFDFRLGTEVSKTDAVKEYMKCPHFLLVEDPAVNAEKKSGISLTSSNQPSTTSSSSADVSCSSPYNLNEEFAQAAAECKNETPALLRRSSVVSPCAWQGQRIFTLRSLDTWSIILATAVASAAFPAAFEPVSLTRFRHELPEGNTGCIRWPIKDANVVEYPFSYVDGGVMNNEPVREAYRMSALIDSLASTVDFQRIILSVDPNISSPSYEFPLPHAPALNLPIHTIEGKYPNLQGVLSTVTALAGSIASTLSREEDKVRETIRIFELRDNFLGKVSSVLNCAGILPNNADGKITICKEQAAPLKELKDSLQAQLTLQKLSGLIPQEDMALYDGLENLASELEYKVDSNSFKKFFEGPFGIENEWDKAELYQCVKCVLYFTMDLLLELPAKNRGAKFIGIAPMWYSKELDLAAHPVSAATATAPATAASAAVSNAACPNVVLHHGPKRPLELPAMKLSGFVGFISPTANAISKLAGKRLATLHLSRINSAPAESPENLGFELLCTKPQVKLLDAPLCDLMQAMKKNKDRILKELVQELEPGTRILVDDVVKFVLPEADSRGPWWSPKNWMSSVGLVGVRRILRPKIIRALKAAVNERYDFELWIHLPSGDNSTYFNEKSYKMRVVCAGAQSTDASAVFVPQADSDGSVPSKYLVLPIQWDLDESKWMCGDDASDDCFLQVVDGAATADGLQQTVRLLRKSCSSWFRKDAVSIDLPTRKWVDLKDVLLRPGPRIFGEIDSSLLTHPQWPVHWSVDELGTKTVLTMEKSLARLAQQNLGNRAPGAPARSTSPSPLHATAPASNRPNGTAKHRPVPSATVTSSIYHESTTLQVGPSSDDADYHSLRM